MMSFVISHVHKRYLLANSSLKTSVPNKIRCGLL